MTEMLVISSRWNGSVLHDNLCRAPYTSLAGVGLVTDIDNTMLLNRGSAKARSAGCANALEIGQLAKANGIPLITATARDIPMMERDCKAGLLPMFDAVLASLGSELFINCDGRYVADEAWHHYIRDTRGFDRKGIYTVCRSFWARAVSQAAEHPDVYGKEFHIEFQPRDTPANVCYYQAVASGKQPAGTPPHNQGPQPFKISFIFHFSLETADALESLLRTILNDGGYTQARIQLSIDSTLDNGLYRQNIDVLPILKDEAASLLANEIDELYGPRLWAFAGDSTNDYPALIGFGHVGIMVGGSDDGLNKAIGMLPVRQAGSRITRLVQSNHMLYRRTTPGPVGPGSILEAGQFYERFVRASRP